MQANHDIVSHETALVVSDLSWSVKYEYDGQTADSACKTQASSKVIRHEVGFLCGEDQTTLVTDDDLAQQIKSV